MKMELSLAILHTVELIQSQGWGQQGFARVATTGCKLNARQRVSFQIDLGCTDVHRNLL